MIYGYSRRVVDEAHGLLELKEITFDLEPSELRAIASFLVSAAEQIESGAMASSHVHIESESSGWDRDSAGADVIVSDPRARVG